MFDASLFSFLQLKTSDRSSIIFCCDSNILDLTITCAIFKSAVIISVIWIKDPTCSSIHCRDFIFFKLLPQVRGINYLNPTSLQFLFRSDTAKHLTSSIHCAMCILYHFPEMVAWYTKVQTTFSLNRSTKRQRISDIDK